MTVFIHSLFLIAQFVPAEITHKLRHDSVLLNKQSFQELCFCKVLVIDSCCRHFTLQLTVCLCCSKAW